MGRVVNLDAYRDMRLGEIARLGRENQGKTQAKVAVECNCHRTLIAKLEKGVVPIPPERAVDLSRALGLQTLLHIYCGRCPVGVALKMGQVKPKAV